MGDRRHRVVTAERAKGREGGRCSAAQSPALDLRIIFYRHAIPFQAQKGTFRDARDPASYSAADIEKKIDNRALNADHNLVSGRNICLVHRRGVTASHSDPQTPITINQMMVRYYEPSYNLHTSTMRRTPALPISRLGQILCCKLCNRVRNRHCRHHRVDTACRREHGRVGNIQVRRVPHATARVDDRV